MPVDIPCALCNLPDASHRAYTAMFGEHDYIPDPLPFPVDDADLAAHEALVAGPRQVPRIVPHPDGGVTQEWVTETPSDRLPARKNPAPEREPGGVSSQPTRRPWAFWRALNERSST